MRLVAPYGTGHQASAWFSQATRSSDSQLVVHRWLALDELFLLFLGGHFPQRLVHLHDLNFIS